MVSGETNYRINFLKILQLTLSGQEETHLCLAVLHLWSTEHTNSNAGLLCLWIRAMRQLCYHFDPAEMMKFGPYGTFSVQEVAVYPAR
jgi:hypothetical protein